MKNITFKTADIQNILAKLTKNLGWIFFMMFLVLLIFEFLEINVSLQTYFALNQSAPVRLAKEQTVRIDFKNYDLALKKIQQANDFIPSGGITNNPFQIR